MDSVYDVAGVVVGNKSFDVLDMSMCLHKECEPVLCEFETYIEINQIGYASCQDGSEDVERGVLRP
jgi:hypothetical protein